MTCKNPLIILLLLASFTSVCAVLYTSVLPDLADFFKEKWKQLINHN